MTIASHKFNCNSYIRFFIHNAHGGEKGCDEKILTLLVEKGQESQETVFSCDLTALQEAVSLSESVCWNVTLFSRDEATICVCPSVRWSVGPLVRWSVGRAFAFWPTRSD